MLQSLAREWVTGKRPSAYRPITGSSLIAIQGQEAECSRICLSLLSM
jgi:hypothetical protein